MKYSELVEYYERLEATDSSLEETDILAELFRDSSPEEIEVLAVLAMGRPFPAWKDLDIGVASKLMVKAISSATGISEDKINDKWKETGDLGVTAQEFVEKKKQQTLMSQELSISKIEDSFEKIAKMEGSGSQDRKLSNIAELIVSSSPEEARYVVRTILGEMRIGVGEGIVRDAVAEAFNIEPEVVQRAYDMTNDFGKVAKTALEEGEEGLKKLKMEMFKPVKVMLAQKVEGMDEGYEKVANEDGVAALEFKYDGMRAQIHKRGDDIRVFTRRLEDVTEQFPDIVKSVKEHVDAEECILDAEVTAYDPDTGDLIPFQKLSKRIKRKYEIQRMVKEIPVTVNVFDVFYLEGEVLLEEPMKERWKKIQDIIDSEERKLVPVNHIETSDKEEAREFYQKALNAKQEGVMLKNLEAKYKPGSRVGYMVKLKPVMENLDLVISGAEWGEGRRKDWLGSFILSCREKETSELKTIGKMATGLTDEQFKEITERLREKITSEEGKEVDIKPELVVEVAYEEIQKSPKYASGYALRFPRLVRFREDLSVEDIDSLSRVKQIYDSQK